jgi:hypothetical protein
MRRQPDRCDDADPERGPDDDGLADDDGEPEPDAEPNPDPDAGTDAAALGSRRDPGEGAAREYKGA